MWRTPLCSLRPQVYNEGGKIKKLHLTYYLFVGVNPMVTIMATCLHIAEQVVESLTGPQSSSKL
jgi:hypothetical protein